MKIQAIKCKGCQTTLFSRTRYDFRTCLCGKTSIDGGFDYLKASFDSNIGFENVELELDVTLEELYRDWNTAEDKYGVIKKE